MDNEQALEKITWQTSKNNPQLLYQLADLKRDLANSGRQVVSESDLIESEEDGVKVVKVTLLCRPPLYEYGTIEMRGGSVFAFTDPRSRKPLGTLALYPFLRDLFNAGWQLDGVLPEFKTEGEYEIKLRRPKKVDNG
ncbi:MAG TPA: hypothetical protein VMH80_06175 [Bryobacteraceae bacterium]|nr:hypothetical protein [Bryobacteraceae bacterium]